MRRPSLTFGERDEHGVELGLRAVVEQARAGTGLDEGVEAKDRTVVLRGCSLSGVLLHSVQANHHAPGLAGDEDEVPR